MAHRGEENTFCLICPLSILTCFFGFFFLSFKLDVYTSQKFRLCLKLLIQQLYVFCLNLQRFFLPNYFFSSEFDLPFQFVFLLLHCINPDLIKITDSTNNEGSRKYSE